MAVNLNLNVHNNCEDAYSISTSHDSVYDTVYWDSNDSIDNDGTCIPITILSYNMHGYNQGCIAVRDIVISMSPDVVFLQEHWLTPGNLDRFCVDFPGYFGFGASAMSSAVESGVLRGRPFGGVMVLIKHSLSQSVQTLCADERLVVVKLCNLLLFNVYLPCVGTENRDLLTDGLCDQMDDWVDKYSDCDCIIGGDFNMNFNYTSASSSIMQSFISKHELEICNYVFSKQDKPTYVNDSLGCSSVIDYFVVKKRCHVSSFDVLDPSINFSDHMPILITYTCNRVGACVNQNSSNISHNDVKCNVQYLRWDYADKISYYICTGEDLRRVFEIINDYEACTVTDIMIDSIYNEIVDILSRFAECFVPRRSKSFYKFWWNEELDELKNKSIQSSSIWKAAGKPRSGPIFNQYRSDKSTYKAAIHEHKDDDAQVYSNDLHDLLLKKQGPGFWRVWRSKFDNNRSGVVHVDGVADNGIIVDKFARHFQKISDAAGVTDRDRLQDEYNNMRQGYCGDLFLPEYKFDACLVERVIDGMKRGKAAGLDSLTAEHLQYCHSLLPAILAKLFYLIVLTGHIPRGFGYSYTVPIPKQKVNMHSKAHKVDDFRGITISPVLSKVFEHCILNRFNRYFVTSDNQFSYKRKLGCTSALHSARCVVEHYINNGTTVSLCALDLSKAFDRINHYGLYIKLMYKCVPIQLLQVVENWFAISVTCVKWQNHFSHFFKLNAGIRQGGVLSPSLFNIYIDNIASVISKCGVGCHLRNASLAVLIYADDILLLAPSVSSLQLLVNLCCTELSYLSLEINYKKSVCMRFGPRFNSECACITTRDGHVLNWVQQCRYLGVEIVSSSVFKCDLGDRKKSFYRSFNSIFGRIGRIASAEVVIELLKKKCLPLLLYACEVLPLNSRNYKSLDYAINCTLRKIFCTNSNEIVGYCREAFDIAPVKDIIRDRRKAFLSRLVNSSLDLLWDV